MGINSDFQDLFPDRDLNNGNLTFITLSQKTVNDMTGWNSDVEAEREQLLDKVMLIFMILSLGCIPLNV